MSKSKPVLSITARSAIVSAYVDALDSVENTGSLVTQVCDKAQQYMKGEPFADDDRKAIVLDISKARGWKGASVKSRQSEVNVILKAYAKLPDAIAALSSKAKKCQWHDSMKLARRINQGDSVQKAVAFALKAPTSQHVSPQGRVAGALKSWHKVATGAKREAILKAADLLGLKLGIAIKH